MSILVTLTIARKISDMRSFDQIRERIQKASENRRAGVFNSILPPFPRMASSYPGWVKGRYTIITASPGVGKTSFSKYFALFSSVQFCVKNKLKCHVLYFALEETSDEFSMSMISLLLYKRYGVKISASQLCSLGEMHLSDDELTKIDNVQRDYETLMQHVEVIDSVSNPTGIYYRVREYAMANGTERTETKRYFNEQSGRMEDHEVFLEYLPNDPDAYVFVITDHLSLLKTEKGHETKYETIGYFSSHFCLGYFCKRYNYVVVNVQQQQADKEKKAFTFRGSSIDEKLEVSLDGLANNRETSRDCDVVLGLFSPSRYDIKKYREYNVEIFGDNIRFVKFLKDRHYGCMSKRLALYFNGASCIFVELPSAEQIKGFEQEYLDTH